MLAVLARRCGWLDPSDREALFHDAYALVLEKEQQGQLDLEQMHERQVRAYLIQTSLNKALDEGKRAERRLTTALDDDAAGQPDVAERLEERVVSAMEGAPVREIVAELPARQQAIVKLRFYFERSPQEVQKLLGMTERTYRRQLERAMKKMAARYELVLSGEWCEDHRSLIIAYVGGLADAEELRLARAHLKGCPGCARMAAELRLATRRTAALLPLPAIPFADGPLIRLADGANALRDVATELVHGAARHVASLFSRVDPAAVTYATTARPGALSATLAACVVLGGTTSYCVVEGVPGPLRAALGVEQAASKEDDDEREPKPRPEPTPAPATPAVVAPVPTTPTPAPTGPSSSETREDAPSSEQNKDSDGDGSSEPTPTSEPAPAPAPAPEFSPEAPAAPAPTAPAPTAPSGGGGGGGSSSGGEFDF